MVVVQNHWVMDCTQLYHTQSAFNYFKEWSEIS